MNPTIVVVVARISGSAVDARPFTMSEDGGLPSREVNEVAGSSGVKLTVPDPQL